MTIRQKLKILLTGELGITHKDCRVMHLCGLYLRLHFTNIEAVNGTGQNMLQKINEHSENQINTCFDQNDIKIQ